MKACRFLKLGPVISGHLMLSRLTHQTQKFLGYLHYSSVFYHEILLTNKKDFKENTCTALSSELQVHRLSKAHNYYLLVAVSTCTIWTGRSWLEVFHLDV